MKNLLHGASFLVVVMLFSASSLLTGCGESVGTTSSENEANSVTLDSLRSSNLNLQAENDQLRKSNSQLDQDKKALNAKVADLTSKLGQSSQQWQDLQELQLRVNSLDSELTAERQVNRDLSARNADAARESMGTSGWSSITTKAQFDKVYNDALKLYKARKYKDAIIAFANLAASKMDNTLVSNAHYWLGESYYGMQKYGDARDEFEKTLSYPKSWKESAAYVMLGMSYLRLGDKEKAKATWQELIKKNPKSSYATKARSYLNQL